MATFPPRPEGRGFQVDIKGILADDIFDYCKQYKSDTGGHQKPLISCSPVNNTMGINKNTYLLESNEGVLLNVDGLSEPARKLVPATFNDSLVMGAFLSGMHNKSLDAAQDTFQIWKDDPCKKEIHELRDNIKDFIKEYSYVRKSNITPYPTFNIEYHLETDLF